MAEDLLEGESPLNNILTICTLWVLFYEGVAGVRIIRTIGSRRKAQLPK